MMERKKLTKKLKLISYIIVTCLIIAQFSWVSAFKVNAAGSVVLRDWSKYTSRILYNMMNADEKGLYDRLDSLCKDILEGNKDPEIDYGNNIYVTPKVNTYNIDTEEKLLKVVNAFVFENPQYYFIRMKTINYSSLRTGKITGVSFCYPDELVNVTTRNNMTNKIFSRLDDYISQISGSNDYEKMKSANEILCQNTQAASGSGTSNYPYQSICSTMVYQEGVCISYTMAFSAMLNAKGISNVVIQNVDRDHVWSKVKLSGKWYNVDAYWNDGGNYLKTKYLAKSDATIAKSDSSRYHIAHTNPSYNIYNPAANEDYISSDSESGSGDTSTNTNRHSDSIDDGGLPREDMIGGKYGYSNEWVGGRWFNADGSQTYRARMSWKSDAKGWWIQDQSGWYPKSCWQKIDGSWYYFGSDGYMACNEWREGYWLSSSGANNYSGVGSWKSNSTGWWFEDTSGWYARNCWQKIDGCWYYFGSDGYMVTSCYIGGYWIGADGVCR